MDIRQIHAKTLLRTRKKIDSWFISHVGMNLYRGCLHNCGYCDGRSEKYRTHSRFGEDIDVKINAVDVLAAELNKPRNQPLLKSGFVFVGGGVGDSYQPIEEEFRLTRDVLSLLSTMKFPLHILTKSTLIRRDSDIITRLNTIAKVIVSISLSSVDDMISEIFEPHVPSPSERLAVLSEFKEKDITCGLYYMPVLPFITDTKFHMEETVKMAKEEDIDFIVFGGLTLKEGRQKEHYFTILHEKYPDVYDRYNEIYTGDKWGNPIASYYESITNTFIEIARKYDMPVRIPHSVFSTVLNQTDLVIVTLEHIDYLLKTQGKQSPYGYAAYQLSKLDVDISHIKHALCDINGIGPMTESIILEVLETGTSSYYERLLK